MQENSWESAFLSAGLLYLVPSNTCLYQVPSPIKLGLVPDRWSWDWQPASVPSCTWLNWTLWGWGTLEILRQARV